VKKRMRGALADRVAAGHDDGSATRGDPWPLAEPFSIGALEIPNRVIQAPLAGIANAPFRVQAQRHGAGLAVSEMVASMGVHHGNARTVDMLTLDPRETLTGIQIFGADPDAMAGAARAAEARGAALIDINMGCPVPKICKTGAGASLLADPELAGRIVRACTDAVDIPVTVKIRRGLTPADARPAETARVLADAGAAAIAIHPRAAAEEYRGTADHAITAEVVAAVDVPVIASGDITSPRAARAVLEQTGAAAVMIGRGALGDPWLYGQIAAGGPSGRPGLVGVIAELVEFAREVIALMGERRGVHYLRKFYPWYFTGEDVPHEAIAELLTLEDFDRVVALLDHLADPRPLATTPGLN
jgi:tRNA-dihydrouridine synthase B